MVFLKQVKTWWLTLSFTQRTLFSLFVVVLIVSRFFLLSQIPTGIHYDELVYVLQAKAFLLSGSDLIGTWNPWRLMPLTSQHAELTTLALLPGFWLFANPLLAGRFMPAVLGITFPFLAGWLAWNLWRERKISWVTVFVAAFNPWVWQLSRMSFDPLPGIWLIFLAAAIITARKFSHKWLVLPITFLSFFHYQGYKILIVPWVVLWSYFAWHWQKTISKQLFWTVAIFAFGLFTFWYAVLLPSQGANQRNQKTIFYDQTFKDQIVSNVMTDRRLSLDNQLQPIAHNKFQALSEYLIKRYVSNFDFATLFILGEPNLSPFSVWSHGFFYMIDLPLLFYGLWVMFTRKKWHRAAFIWGILFLIMPLPRLLTTVNEWMIFRGSIGYMLMLFPIAIGLTALLTQPKQWLKWGVIALYGLFIARFTYDYFYRYPLYSTNGLYFEQRVLASYLHRQPANTSITDYTSEPEFLLFSYLNYNRLVDNNSLPDIRQNLQHGQYRYDNVTFTNECVPEINNTTGLVITERNQPHCPPAGLTEAEIKLLDLALEPGNSLSISSPLDSGEIFWIYNDALCQHFVLTTFVDVNHLTELAVEQLADQRFCELWIKDVNPLRVFSPIDSQ